MLDEADEADEAWCGWQLHATQAAKSACAEKADLDVKRCETKACWLLLLFSCFWDDPVGALVSY